jgi:hypothetical protein
MCPSGTNTVDSWPGNPEVICSVEEYFQTRGGAFENVNLPNHYLCFTAQRFIMLNSKSFGSHLT